MDKNGELRIHDSLDELKTDLADYIEELSEVSVKERGIFTIALSGGSLISLMGYQRLSFSYLVYLFFAILLFFDATYGGKQKTL